MQLYDVVATSQAHRVALGAYSEALSSVLGSYSSGEIIRLDLTDFQSEAVITILRFLYTTELHLDCDTVGQVNQNIFFLIILLYWVIRKDRGVI